MPPDGGDGLPDLQISNIYFEQGTNQVIMRIENVGNGDVPPDVGVLTLFVDHLKVTEIPFPEIPDQTFLNAGGSSVVPTGIHLAGTGRRIIGVIDSKSEISEENEYQNMMSFEIDPPETNGFDLELIAAVNEQHELYFELKNLGSEPSPPNLDLDFSIDVEESPDPTSYVEQIPSVAAGAQYILNPAQTLTVSEPTKIRAWFQAAGDMDDSNNNFEAKLQYLTLADIPTRIYNDLLTNNQKITANLFFSGDPERGHNSCYDDCYDDFSEWPPSMKVRLHEFLLLLEQGRKLPLSPPEYLEADGDRLRYDNTYISVEKAEEIYLANVAQGLWFDKNHAPWKLEDLSEKHVDLLFPSKRYLYYGGGKYAFTFGSDYQGSSVAWNPPAIYLFMKHLDIIKPTQEGTFFKLADWYRSHVWFNSITKYGPFSEIKYGTRGTIQTERVAYPLASGLLQHVHLGCHEGVGWVRATLRTLNIPVIYGTFAETVNGHYRGGHGFYKIPTVRKSSADVPGIRIWHSDELTYKDIRPWGPSLGSSTGVIPSDRYFFSYKEAEDWLESPLDLDVDPDTGETNTEPTQAGQNNGRFYALMAKEFLIGPYLWTYAVRGPEYTDQMLKGWMENWPGSQLGPTALPYLDLVERQEFLGELEAGIIELGGGDFHTGVSEIARLRYVFNEGTIPKPYEPGRLRITTVHPPQVTTNHPYSANMVATGGTGSGYEWSIIEGTLAPGITLSSGTEANFSGTPTQAGEFYFTIKVTDDGGNEATRKTVMLVDYQYLLIDIIAIPDATLGVPYSVELPAKGGTEEGYQWSWYPVPPPGQPFPPPEDPILPPGLSLAPTGTPSTTISGTPTQAGEFHFRVTVTDNADHHHRRTIALTVNP